jgi:hypothetical protein
LPTAHYDVLGTNDYGEHVRDHSAFWVAKGGETNGAWFGILKVRGRLSLEEVDRICAG